MSSLIVSGDTSGAITVAAPAVAGTYTNTLPQITGTLSTLDSGTAKSASGTSVNFTGIPANVKRITVIINGLSYAAAGSGGIQIGSGTLSTTGYVNNGMNFTGTPTNIQFSGTTGFGSLSTSAAGSTVNGICVLVNSGSNTWTYVQNSFRTTDNVSTFSTGYIALGGSLDLLSLVATTSTFDAGTINILYE